MNYKCTASAKAFFTITGANDTGPGAYRLQNQTQPTQYMAYTITTVNVPGTKITLNGQLVAANYQNAYVGNYADTLSVLIISMSLPAQTLARAIRRRRPWPTPRSGGCLHSCWLHWARWRRLPRQPANTR